MHIALSFMLDFVMLNDRSGYEGKKGEEKDGRQGWGKRLYLKEDICKYTCFVLFNMIMQSKLIVWVKIFI